jgi:hypothetical protein
MEPGPLAEVVGSDASVLKITRQLSARIGGEYFRAMSTYLTQELKADCVFVGEFTPGPVERVTALAACLEGEQANLSFDLAGSACLRIARTGQPLLCREKARKRFPQDQMLLRVHAEAFIGVPLQDSAAKPIGVIMATYRGPLASRNTAKSVLEVLAARSR